MDKEKAEKLFNEGRLLGVSVKIGNKDDVDRLKNSTFTMHGKVKRSHIDAKGILVIDEADFTTVEVINEDKTNSTCY